jgi:hypothetical protein
VKDEPPKVAAAALDRDLGSFRSKHAGEPLIYWYMLLPIQFVGLGGFLNDIGWLVVVYAGLMAMQIALAVLVRVRKAVYVFEGGLVQTIEPFST